MAGSNFIVRGGADFSAINKALTQTQTKLNTFSKNSSRSLNKGFTKAQSAFSDFKSGASKALKAVGAAVSAFAIGKLVKDSTALAMSVESAMGNIQRSMGTASKAFENWVNTQSKSLGMARADAYKYGSTFSNLLSSFIGGAEETAAQTQELMKAASVISSMTGRSFEDVSERIRSGLLGSTEAIEDLGVYVNVSMLESTKAFKKFANGKSWNQLTYQTQQQIRLAAILEQTYERYGDTLANTTATKQQRFLATLQNIKLNIGQAFLPIYNVVLPALDSLASKIEQITAQFAAGMQAIFGAPKAVQQQAKAVSNLGEAAEEAGKKAKKSLAGFDEINRLTSGDAADTKGASTAGTTASTGASIDIAQPNVAWVDVVKTKLSGLANFISIKFAPSINSWGIAFKKLIPPAKKAFDNIKTSVSNLWSNTLAPFGNYLTSNWIPGIVNPFSNTLAPIFSDVMAVAFTEFALDFEYACQNISRIVKDILTPAFDLIKRIATDVFGSIKKAWDERGAQILLAFQKFKEGLREIWNNLYDAVFKPVFEKIASIVEWLWDKHLKKLWDNLNDFIGSFAEYFLTVWNSYLLPVINRIISIVGPGIVNVVTYIGNVFGTIFGGIADVIGGLIKTLTGLMDFVTGVFTGDWKRAWEGIKNIFKGIWDALVGIVKVPINMIIDAMNLLIRGLNNIKIDIPDWVPFMGGKKFGLTIKEIPKLAQGGIAYGPSFVQVAEYAGARSNPEVIAPLDRLEDMIANIAGGDINLTANILLDDGAIVGRTTQRITRQNRLAGASLLGV